MEWDLVRSFFIALLAITNPLSKIPLWLAGSEGEDRQAEWRLALLVTATATAILLVFLLGGRWFLELFGIDLPSFRIGGGIVILLVAIDMIHGRAIRFERGEEDDDDDKMVAARSRFKQVAVPLAMPMMAGPGSISTVVMYASRVDSLGGYASLAGALGVVMLLMFLMLLSGRRVERWVGKSTLDIQTRVFGLILTGIAVQFIVEGLGEIFPAWLTEASAILDELRSRP
jgi:multiple antibiotic resistance protein